MAFTTNSTNRLQAQINVTPLIDVVLVLLIIFLVTMPITLKQVTLEIPRVLGNDEISLQSPIVIAVDADMSVSIDDGFARQTCDLLQIPSRLAPLLKSRDASGQAVFVTFDRRVSWTDLVDTVDQIRSLAADADHNDITVALGTEPPHAQNDEQHLPIE
jgi:biopolymer transport protein TolR